MLQTAHIREGGNALSHDFLGDLPLHIKSGAGFPPGVVFFSAGEMPSFADKTAFRKADKTHCI